MSKVTNDPARRSAQDIRDRNKQQDVDTRRSVQRAEAAKTARSRELRLAKSAADREIAKRAERLDARLRPHRGGKPDQWGASERERDWSGKMESVE